MFSSIVKNYEDLKECWFHKLSVKRCAKNERECKVLGKSFILPIIVLPIIVLKVLGTTLTNVGNIVKYNKTL